MVPINDHLAALLLSHIHGAAPTQFVFGNPYQHGKKSGPQGATRTDYFKPSAFIIKRDTATKLWNSMFMEGLEIKKHLYALKHTGGNDKILAGISPDALKRLYGHTSKLTMEIYANKVKDVYRDQLVNGSPDFI